MGVAFLMEKRSEVEGVLLKRMAGWGRRGSPYQVQYTKTHKHEYAVAEKKPDGYRA